MKVEQIQWNQATGWTPKGAGLLSEAQLVLVFGSPSALGQDELIQEVRRRWPKAQLFGCSTAGEIYGTQVLDETLVVTSVLFDSTRIKGAQAMIRTAQESASAGRALAQSLRGEKLVHVLVLSDGIHVNGSELVSGLTAELPSDVTITGGLSADGARFRETLVLWDGPPVPFKIAAIGLYGDRLKVGCGSLGGWDSFGPERLITSSRGNVLLELDGRSALELYKEYLGDHAKGLPATGLLFPLSIRTRSNDTPVVRTILSISEEEKSLTFAGDIPQGCYARLMKANFDRLIDGAAGAAKRSHESMGSLPADLAILISCVGRKLVLKQRIEEEVEGVRDILGEGTVLTGFYSYGEISPFTPSARCELHNQTMTITTLSER